VNLARLTAPDFALGKALLTMRAGAQLAAYLARTPSRQAFARAGRIAALVPRHTMLSVTRLVHLTDTVRRADALGLSGDIVECGAWNGGAAAIMAAAAYETPTAAAVRERIVWVFDSFAGLPPPGAHDGPTVHRAFFAGWCTGDPANVEAAFRRTGVPRERLRTVAGWFDDTLPVATVGEIAVLHVDCDWYEPVRTVLRTLYDRVVPGGFVTIDDYGLWPGAQRAVDEHLAARRIDPRRLQPVDGQAVWFQKP
jgi:O-methyltransferase